MWERGLKYKPYEECKEFRESLPLWERGLKYQMDQHNMDLRTSLPLWERGLKLYIQHLVVILDRVAPLVGAWIEMYNIESQDNGNASLPLWERGLK